MKLFYTIILTICIGSFHYAKAQEVLLDENVYQDSVKGKWGQNLSNWMHFYGAFGFITPINQNTNSPIYFGKASNWELGLRYKKRLTNWLAIGANISYDFYNYRLEQSKDKTLPDSLFYDKQKIVLNTFSMQPFLRINYGRRGNKIGNYIDFGFFYNAVFSNAEKQKGTPSGLDKVKKKNLQYIAGDYYGFYTNIGFGRFVIYGKYNYSPIIKGNPSYSDLPPITIGLQVGFF